MANTIREQLIVDFLNRAAALPLDNLERSRRAHDVGSGINASIWDGEDVAEDLAFGIQHLSFPIAIEMQWMLSGNENASQSLNKLLGDTIKAIMAGGKLALSEKLRYTSASPEYPADGSGLVSLTVIFTIYYATKVDDPFVVA